MNRTRNTKEKIIKYKTQNVSKDTRYTIDTNVSIYILKDILVSTYTYAAYADLNKRPEVKTAAYNIIHIFYYRNICIRISECVCASRNVISILVVRRGR